MDSKTRAKLRSMASSLSPSVIIGKEGLSINVIKQIEMELDARELVKISVLSQDENYKEMLNSICEKTGAEPVCAIGKKLVIYRFSRKKKAKHVLVDF